MFIFNINSNFNFVACLLFDGRCLFYMQPFIWIMPGGGMCDVLNVPFKRSAFFLVSFYPSEFLFLLAFIVLFSLLLDYWDISDFANFIFVRMCLRFVWTSYKHHKNRWLCKFILILNFKLPPCFINLRKFPSNYKDILIKQ